MRLYFLGVVISNNVARYKFLYEGKEIALMSRDARDLVSSIPNNERDCKVAFNQITLKSVVTRGKKVMT